MDLGTVLTSSERGLGSRPEARGLPRGQTVLSDALRLVKVPPNELALVRGRLEGVLSMAGDPILTVPLPAPVKMPGREEVAPAAVGGEAERLHVQHLDEVPHGAWT